MKKLLLSLMVLATLVSCGKDNKVSSNSNYSYSNGYLSGDGAAYASDLVARVNAYTTHFGNGQLLTTGSSSGQCGTFWKIFNYCYGNTGGNYAYSGLTWNALAAQQPNVSYLYSRGTVIPHSSVPVATKQSELIGLINSAVQIQVSGPMYYIQLSNGVVYVIDVRYPLQANPSAVSNQNGVEYLVRAI